MEPDSLFLDHLIDWAALLVSGIALVVSIRVHRRTAPLIDRQIAAHDAAAAERQKARIVGEITWSEMWKGGRKRYTVVLRNVGQAEARNVTLAFHDRAIVPDSELGKWFPIKNFPPGAKLEIPVPRAGPFEAVLTWTDLAGEQTQETTIG